MNIALVSCKNLPEPDFDEAPSLAALRAAGHEASAPGWDDPEIDWASFDLAILRATWNYPFVYPEFLAWLDRAQSLTRLLNPAEVVHWNADKRYLLELADRGILIVPTHLVDQHHPCDVADLARARGWDSVVVKPVIGAGSWRTRRFEAGRFTQATEFVRTLANDGGVLVQQARDEFNDPGERSIVWIAGEPTHAVVKRPRFDEDDETVVLGQPASHEERGLIDRLLSMIPGEVLYARLDVITSADGPMLSELELIEPSLFFPHAPHALDRLVEAVNAMERSCP